MYNTGLIPSRFYEVLLDSDKASFKSIVVTSSLLILGTALVSCEIEIWFKHIFIKLSLHVCHFMFVFE